MQQDAMGKFSVDLGVYGWFPPVLPSDLAELGSQQAEQVDWGEVQDRDERENVSDLGDAA